MFYRFKNASTVRSTGWIEVWAKEGRAKANAKKIDNSFMRSSKVYHQFNPLQSKKTILLLKSLPTHF